MVKGLGYSEGFSVLEKFCYLENRVVREPCKQRTACSISVSKLNRILVTFNLPDITSHQNRSANFVSPNMSKKNELISRIILSGKQ